MLLEPRTRGARSRTPVETADVRAARVTGKGENGGDHPMAEEIKHFIDGKPASGRSGRTAPVFDPATGEQAGRVALASAAEVDEGVRIGGEASWKWARTPPLR